MNLSDIIPLKSEAWIPPPSNRQATEGSIFVCQRMGLIYRFCQSSPFFFYLPQTEKQWGFFGGCSRIPPSGIFDEGLTADERLPRLLYRGVGAGLFSAEKSSPGRGFQGESLRALTRDAKNARNEARNEMNARKRVCAPGRSERWRHPEPGGGGRQPGQRAAGGGGEGPGGSGREGRHIPGNGRLQGPAAKLRIYSSRRL
ncbi:unnamed protein product [Pleuronectes platessa]|uniref:Uncharacterized protein n=1 Tax=Pleuronectes platessa TaxID=8262 RepID=A0A9N7TZG7_PLEPL|nr:unnamed protein product [Pleuronectes platessa]